MTRLTVDGDFSKALIFFSSSSQKLRQPNVEPYTFFETILLHKWGKTDDPAPSRQRSQGFEGLFASSNEALKHSDNVFSDTLRISTIIPKKIQEKLGAWLVH